MKSQKYPDSSIHNWWSIIIRKPLPAFRNWLTKENVYLRKNIKRNSKVLDVGCGAGRHIKLLANIAKEIYGIDWDREAVRDARKNLSKFRNAKIFFEVAQKMHFKNNTFDYVICMGNTFGDFGTNKLKILKEMKRVVQRDGKIIISVYSEKALPTRIENHKIVGATITKISKDGIIYTKEGFISEQFSKEKLKNISKKADLKISEIIELTPISFMCEMTK